MTVIHFSIKQDIENKTLRNNNYDGYIKPHYDRGYRHLD